MVVVLCCVMDEQLSGCMLLLLQVIIMVIGVAIACGNTHGHERGNAGICMD